jgi:glycosyltransferase involved in cell wall biosynthesis
VFLDSTVAVAVPAHNEERLVARTLGRVPGFVDMVLAVDDASDDATWSAIERAAAADARITAIRHDVNAGVGAAIVTAYRAALRRGADVVVVMDGDGQMDPDDLPALLTPVCSGRADLAKGFRFDGLVPRGPMPFVRIVGNHVLSAATRIAGSYGDRLDAQCGYTAITAEALARLPLQQLFPRYGFPNDLVLRALEAGLRLEAVPVRAVYDTEVSGIRPHVAIPRILLLLARGFVRRRMATPTRFDRPATAEADEG